MQAAQDIRFPMMESFYTIQGEGAFTGAPSYFIRLGGCDVGCVWCDVKESWDAHAHQAKSIQELLSLVNQAEANRVVVTGGEPCMYDLNELTNRFREDNLKLHLETSGVYEITGEWDWVCFSPKKFKKPKDSVYAKADELKVVVFHPSDLEWAQKHAEKVGDHCKLYLQPEWDRRDQVLPIILNHVRENPEWNISLQTHKYIGVP